MSLFLLPAAVALVLMVFHIVSGGREIARPLLASRELPADVIYVLYMCWHVVTLMLAASALAYFGAAFDPSLRPYAIAATAFSGAISLWTLIVVLWKRQSHRKLPQWIAFLVLTLCGVWALL